MNTFTKTVSIALTSLALTASAAVAAPIGIGDFSGSETIEDFSTLGIPPVVSDPFTHNGIGFSQASSGTGFSGWLNIVFDGTNTLADGSGISDITIDLASPFERAGFDLFGSVNAIYDVSFFDSALVLLGTVSLDFAGFDGATSQFAGWEDIGGVSRVRLVETSGEDGSISAIDNIRFENPSDPTGAVPLPAGLPLLLSAMAVFGLARRRKG